MGSYLKLVDKEAADEAAGDLSHRWDLIPSSLTRQIPRTKVVRFLQSQFDRRFGDGSMEFII